MTVLTDTDYWLTPINCGGNWLCGVTPSVILASKSDSSAGRASKMIGCPLVTYTDNEASGSKATIRIYGSCPPLEPVIDHRMHSDVLVVDSFTPLLDETIENLTRDGELVRVFGAGYKRTEYCGALTGQQGIAAILATKCLITASEDVCVMSWALGTPCVFIGENWVHKWTEELCGQTTKELVSAVNMALTLDPEDILHINEYVLRAHSREARLKEVLSVA